MNPRDAFLREVAAQVDWWSNEAALILTDVDSAPRWVSDRTSLRELVSALDMSGVPTESIRSAMKSILGAFAGSMLVIFDGGTALEDRVRLIDRGGEPIGEGLHEDLPRFLRASADGNLDAGGLRPSV